MSFGQQAPPATPKQVAYLQSLLAKEGYASFREARRAFGLTQRQAGGKFTRPEASALIDRLLGNEDASKEDGRDGDQLQLGAAPLAGAPVGAGPDEVAAGADAVVDQVRQMQADLVRGLPAEVLADELSRRGWTVAPPD